MDKEIEKQEETTELWQDYENAVAYQGNIGLSKKIPEFVKFYEGQQWPEATERTKSLPRPVINLIKMIVRNKKSAILSVKVNLKYQADDPTVDVEKFNDFAAYIQKEIGQEALDEKAVADGVKKGPYAYHYYWDSEARGMKGSEEGALRCEVIDALNVCFANPRELDEQKQEWIIIVGREDLESVRAKCDKDINPEDIRSDESQDRYSTVEQKGKDLVTVLTRYFRKDGEVYFEKATRSVLVNKPRPLAPDLQAAGKALGFEVDAANNALPDSPDMESMNATTVKAGLYPIVFGNYEYRENSIYGMGEIEGLIPNQRAINFNFAMLLLNAQEMAWGKYIVHPNALRGQTISNVPGQVLTDFSQTGNGIKRMTENAISSQPLQLVESLIQITRTMTGANEVMSGEVLKANMSGSAIAQLQAQADKPIEDLRDTFWRVKEKQGKVLAQFFKLFYTGKEFPRETKNVPPMAEMGSMPPTTMGSMLPTKPQKEIVRFDSSEYQNVDFSVVVEATTGTKASAAGDINVLDTLLAKGAISLKTYINAYPEDAMSNKTELLKGIEEEENGQRAQLQAQVQQLQAALEQAQTELAQAAQTIQSQEAIAAKAVSLMKENQSLRSLLLSLYTESKQKIVTANEQLKKDEYAYQELYSAAQRLANELVEAKNATAAMPPSQMTSV